MGQKDILTVFKKLKGKYPESIIIIRGGDFYMTYMEDARETSTILEITLTRHKDVKMNTIEETKFPHYALDIYLPKLIRAGKRVAICDSIESFNS